MRSFSLEIGGARRDRTADLLHAMQALSQLSYSPTREARNVLERPARVKKTAGFFYWPFDDGWRS
jgi:hypothetical protein